MNLKKPTKNYDILVFDSSNYAQKVENKNDACHYLFVWLQVVSFF